MQSAGRVTSTCGKDKFTDITNFELTRSEWVNKKYKDFFEKHNYLPKFFEVYNGLEVKNYAPTLSTNRDMQKSTNEQPKIKVLGRLNINGHDLLKRIYSIEGCCPTLTTMMGGANPT